MRSHDLERSSDLHSDNRFPRPIGPEPAGPRSGPTHHGMRLNRSGQFTRGVSVFRGLLMETAMTVETTQRLTQLANQLAENLMTVAICAEELRATIRAEVDAAGIE